MFTQIKQKDLNTPLMQRVERFLAQQKKQSEDELVAAHPGDDSTSKISDNVARKENLPNQETIALEGGGVSVEFCKLAEPKKCLFVDKIASSGENVAGVSDQSKGNRPNLSNLKSRNDTDASDVKSIKHKALVNTGFSKAEINPKDESRDSEANVILKNNCLTDLIENSLSDVVSSVCDMDICGRAEALEISTRCNKSLSDSSVEKVNENITSSPVAVVDNFDENQDLALNSVSRVRSDAVKSDCVVSGRTGEIIRGIEKIENDQPICDNTSEKRDADSGTCGTTGVSDLCGYSSHKDIGPVEDLKTPSQKCDQVENIQLKRKTSRTLQRIHADEDGKEDRNKPAEAVPNADALCPGPLDSGATDHPHCETVISAHGISEAELSEIHIQFEDEDTEKGEKSVLGKRKDESRSEGSEVDSASCLPGSAEDEIVVKKPRQRCRKRRSADFEVLSAEVTLSPDISLDGLEHIQAKVMPGTRRSKRLKRKSIELCRRSATQLPNVPAQADVATSGCDGIDAESATPSTPKSLPATPNTPLSQSGQSETAEGNSGEDVPRGFTPEEDGKAARYGGAFGEVEECVKTPDSSTGDQVTILEESSNRRSRRKRTVSNSSSCQSPASATPSPARKTVTPRRRNKKAEPSVEDIYLNKLWKSQMPVDKSWETIHEEPKMSKSGQEELMGPKRLKRSLDYDDFYTQQRLKRRRRKAIKLGYKAPTKPKLSKAENRVRQTIAALDKEIAEVEVLQNFGNKLLNQDNSCETENRIALESVTGVTSQSLSAGDELATSGTMVSTSKDELHPGGMDTQVSSTVVLSTEEFFTPLKYPVESDSEEFKTPFSTISKWKKNSGSSGDSPDVLCDPNVKHWDELFSKSSVRKRTDDAQKGKKSSVKDGGSAQKSLFKESAGTQKKPKGAKAKRHSLGSITEELEVIGQLSLNDGEPTAAGPSQGAGEFSRSRDRRARTKRHSLSSIAEEQEATEESPQKEVTSRPRSWKRVGVASMREGRGPKLRRNSLSSIAEEVMEESRDNDAAVREGETKSREDDTEAREGETKSRENDAEAREGETKSRENDAEAREGETKSRENDAETRENDGESHEHKVESRESKAESCRNGSESFQKAVRRQDAAVTSGIISETCASATFTGNVTGSLDIAEEKEEEMEISDSGRCSLSPVV